MEILINAFAVLLFVLILGFLLVLLVMAGIVLWGLTSDERSERAKKILQRIGTRLP